jgi:predicted house-cleaning NTP pyrophosphatase (Maf/HAM1 superfamily)
MPIEQLKSLNQQLIQFYSSANLLHLYEQLKLTKNINQHSNTTMIFQRQTNDLIENYLSIKDRILQHIEILEKIQQQTNKYQTAKEKAENTIEKAKELVTLEENTILPLDDQQIETMLQKYKVKIILRNMRRGFTFGFISNDSSVRTLPFRDL